MGAKSLGPVTRAPGRAAEPPAGSETLTDAALVADRAIPVAADASPTCACTGGAHSARIVSPFQPLGMRERTASSGGSPGQLRGVAPQAVRSGRAGTSGLRVDD